MENNQKLDGLIQRLEELSRKQDFFAREINNLRAEIKLLKLTQSATQPKDQSEITQVKPEVSEQTIPIPEPQVLVQQPIVSNFEIPKRPKQPSDLEKIIGESWLNKIGILGIIIGVTILGKYSIDNNLISPLTRIILGYVRNCFAGVRNKA